MLRHTSLRCSKSNFAAQTKRKLHNYDVHNSSNNMIKSQCYQQRSNFIKDSRINIIIPRQSFGTSSIQIQTILCPKYQSLNLSTANESQQQQILACSSHSSKSSKIHKFQPNSNIVSNIINRITHLARSLWDAIMVLFRTSEIGIRLSPLLILTPAAILASQRLLLLDHNDKNNSNRILSNKHRSSSSSLLSNISWKYTLYTIQKLGPAFIKVSQWASTRRDIFPSNVCDRLSELNDTAFLHSWDHTHQVLTKSLGDDYEKWLKVDKCDIVGSGSVAQVYSGFFFEQQRQEQGDDDENYDDNNHDGKERRMKERKWSKRRVAVKVLHPNIQNYVERDLLLMKRAAALIDSIPSKTIQMLSLPRACKNFTDILHLQVDLRNESQNLDKFRQNFNYEIKEDSKVSFPQPILSECDCLVEDYMVDSKPISEYLFDDSSDGMAIRRKLAGPLLRAFLKMVFMDNFVHCDLHPGNILVKKSKVFEPISWWDKVVRSDDGKSSIGEDKYTIIFLDAGIVTTLNNNDQQNLKDLFKAVILNDGEEAGRLMVERARYERCSEIDGGVENFSKGVGAIVAEFHDRRKQGLTLGVVRIGALLGSVLDLCRQYQVEVDPAMANIVMSVFVLEGLGRALEPNLNLIDIALPFILGRGKV